MKKNTYFAFAIFLGLSIVLGGACNSTKTPTASKKVETERIISLNGAITEVLFDLGLGEQIVGIDVTSVYPEETASIANLGHISQINVEAVLQLNPSVLLVEDEPLARKNLAGTC